MGYESRKLSTLTRQYDEKIKERDWQGACEIADNLVNLVPKQSLYYTYRGFVYYKLGKTDRAETDFSEALTLAPKNPQIPQWWLSKIAQDRSPRKVDSEGEKKHYIIFYPYKWVHLHPGKIFRIGRDWENDIIVPSNDVSRFHAEISWNDECYVLKDLGSTNKTSVNGGFIHEYRLKDGDDIEIGNITLHYALQNSSEGPGDRANREKDRRTHRITVSRKTLEAAEKILSGDLSQIGLWQVMQMLSADKKTGCLAIYSKSQGKIFLRRGTVTGCRTEHREGEPVFYDMLGWQQGRFEFDPDADLGEETMDCPVEYLLFRGARHLDERELEASETGEPEL